MEELDPDLFEGDIKLTAEQRQLIDEINNGQRKAIRDLAKRWPRATVPYVIGDYVKSM